MINAKAFANATATVVVIVFVICRLVAWAAPGLMFQLGQSWFHTFQLEPTQMTSEFSFGPLLLGLLGAAIISWVVAYGIMALYNWFTDQ